MTGVAFGHDMPSLSDLSTECRLEPWFSDVLRDPLSKDHLLVSNGSVTSSWGRSYPTDHGILDLRLYGSENGVALREWSEGQLAYEAFSEHLVTTGTVERYLKEIEGVRPVYEEISIRGSCLDVGGFDGRVRHFMSPEAPYACVEPYIFAIRNIAQPALTSAYPELKEPCNFVCGHAEHLPIAGEVFDTVHMRSVIDHFVNPLLALIEAARVLRPGGQLIVGVSVQGGPTGIPSVNERLRELARSILVGIGMERFRDHHIWHPTFPELKVLINRAGFLLDKVHWQASEGGRVVYLQASKPRKLTDATAPI